MPDVQWKTISLKGFGIYREGVRVELAGGLNILAAPNESGKSTLVAGLRAVIFGLPNLSDESSFGTARFRSWEEADSFAGEVTFTVDGVPYRIKRQFASHQVTLSRREKEEWREVFSGTHNPRAHTDSGAYGEHLQTLFGMTRGEVFTDTFCVEQPLPLGEQLSEHVQTLLSGSGNHFGAALDWLKNEAAALTRYLKKHGFKRDNNKDRELERLERQIEELEDRLAAGKGVAEELQATLQARVRLEEEYAQLKKELQGKRQLKEAWGEGRQQLDRYQDLLSKQRELRNAQVQLQALEGELNSLRQEIDRDFALWLTVPERWPEDLELLLDLEQETENLAEQLRGLRDLLAAKDREGEEIKGALAELQAFERNPRLPADFREYQRLHREYRQLCADLKDLAVKKDEARQQLTRLPDWGRLGDDPLGELRELQTRVERLLRFWRQWEDCGSELTVIQEKLRGDYACFQDLVPSQKEALAQYQVRKLALETGLREKERLLREAQGEYDRFARQERAFEQEYEDLAGVDEDELQEKLELLEEMKEARRKVQASPHKPDQRKAFLVPGGLAAAAGIIGWLAGEVVGLLAGLFLGLVLGLVLGRFLPGTGPEKEAVRRLQELETRLAEREARWAPSLKELNEVDLRLLLDKFRRRRGEAQKLEEERERLRQFDLPGLEEGVKQAKERLAEFHRELAHQEAAFGEELPRAYAHFLECTRRQQQLEEQRKQLLREEFQVASLELPCDQWPRLWQQLRTLGKLQGQSLPSLRAVIQWLLTLDEVWWQAALTGCGEWEKWQDELSALLRKEDELKDPDREGRAKKERYEEQLAVLQEQVAPYGPETPEAEVEAAAGRYQELREAWRGLEETKKQLESQIRDAGAKRDNLVEQAEELKNAYAAYLALGQGDTRATKTLWQTFQEKQQSLSLLEEKKAGLLGGLQAETAEELAERLLHLDNQVNFCLSRLEELTRKHPGLPSFVHLQDGQRLEVEYRQLAGEVEELEAREEALKEQERELGRKQAALEGKEPLNLAQGELELAELRRQQKALEFEVKALGIAYRELQAAINDYNASYRERLAMQATRYFRRMTGSDREVMVDEDFSVKVWDRGSLRLAGQFSQGTKDQLFLALRLAIGDLLAEEINLPFIFDDPFLNYDEDRLEEARRLLQQLAEERQIFFLSHREELTGWGTPVTVVKG